MFAYIQLILSVVWHILYKVLKRFCATAIFTDRVSREAKAIGGVHLSVRLSVRLFLLSVIWTD